MKKKQLKTHKLKSLTSANETGELIKKLGEDFRRVHSRSAKCDLVISSIGLKEKERFSLGAWTDSVDAERDLEWFKVKVGIVTE